MNSAVRILFRADGNTTIGLGHMVRSLALADMVRAVAPGLVLARTPPAVVRELVAQAGLPLLELPELAPAEEADYLLARVLRPTDVLVLDGYGFDSDYRRRVRASGCRLVCLDDLHAGFFPADLIINHSPGVTAADYQAEPTTRFCLGPAFSLLRPPFLRHAALPRPAGPVASVLVCFGGADPLQLTARMLAALLALGSLARIGLLLGGAAAAPTAIQALLAAHPQQQVTLYRSLLAEEMVPVLLGYDAVICPASTILIESLVLGRPVITGYYADNQRALAAYVHAHQQAHSVGDFAAYSDPPLAAALRAGLSRLATQPRQPYAQQLAPDELRARFRALLPGA
ncbi:UDP-2,4-diacetamido-2,4,6-trideoxy-beta-L-altropyranose hydrolase [Hymenobacter rubripertinctus]|uniref:UDP-2,4-diacetamido-2,4, 6-trideoxy-beta-L-altropyranose hydrolase n=1 Tax=Hymenobacter rubripertinctus TaxID=2029981 RepID=UPI001603C9D3|nr:UDP-2,4-diacetamido-2,4,6-trideoxy-beta-L-altropyranose hydrolase [Hymenobacter rubripertinctus]